MPCRFDRFLSLIPLLFTVGVPLWGQVPIDQSQSSLESALKASQNPHLKEHAYILIGSIWPKSKISVCWENPSSQFQTQMDLVKQELSQSWEKESQLNFTGWEKCAEINRGIRILIDDSGPHTKGLGVQLDGKPNGMVLNFTFNTWSPSCKATLNYCIKAIAGHEFGHAVGFAHEQNRPDTPGECKEPPQGGNGDKLLTPYDKHSIMNYCNQEWNNNGKLSVLDIDAVHQIYGAPR